MSEELLYEGKAKKVYVTDEEGVLLHRYKDDATAFDGKKRGTIGGKGRTNATMSAAVFEYLETQGVPTHFVERADDESIKTKTWATPCSTGTTSGSSGWRTRI